MASQTFLKYEWHVNECPIQKTPSFSLTEATHFTDDLTDYPTALLIILATRTSLLGVVSRCSLIYRTVFFPFTKMPHNFGVNLQ